MHDLIDTKSRVIVSRKVSEAHSSAERRVCIEMLDEVLAQQDVLGLPNRPEVISLDGGYGTDEMAAALLDRGVLPHMPLQAGPEMERCPRGSGRPTICRSGAPGTRRSDRRGHATGCGSFRKRADTRSAGG